MEKVAGDTIGTIVPILQTRKLRFRKLSNQLKVNVISVKAKPRPSGLGPDSTFSNSSLFGILHSVRWCLGAQVALTAAEALVPAVQETAHRQRGFSGGVNLGLTCSGLAGLPRRCRKSPGKSGPHPVCAQERPSPPTAAGTAPGMSSSSAQAAKEPELSHEIESHPGTREPLGSGGKRRQAAPW